MKGVYIFLADGFEETEAIATWDVLRRSGIDARLVSINESRTVTGSHGLTVTADMVRSVFEKESAGKGTSSEDVMVFPGGLPGAKNLANDSALMETMRQHYTEGGTVAAICAAPGLVASQLPGLKGKKFTCFEGFEEPTIAQGGEYERVPAVADGNLITGRGAGWAVEFALKIVGHIKDGQTVAKTKAGLML